MIYRFEGFEVDEAEFRIAHEDLPIPLEPKALRLLLYLLENRNRLVRKQEILDCVWQESNVTENALTRVVALLRKALGDDSRVPRFIETVPTLGYRFIASVRVEGDVEATITPYPDSLPAEVEEAEPDPGPLSLPISDLLPVPEPEFDPSTALPAGARPIGVSSSVPAPSPITRRRLLYGGAAAAAAGGIWFFTSSRRRPLAPAVHVAIQLLADSAAGDNNQRLGAPVVAPDGSAIVVCLTTPAGPSLFHRPLDSNRMTRIEGTEDAAYPFWSPDSQHIGFFAQGKLKRMPAAGGSATVLCDAMQPRGASWGTRGDILFAVNLHALSRVSERGGDSIPVTALDAATGENSHRFPVFLPDGRRFLYFVRTDDLDRRGIYLASLDRPQPGTRVLVADGEFALGKAGDSGRVYLITQQGKKIVAQAFDLGEGTVSGSTYPLVDHIGQVSVSDTGVLVLRTLTEFNPRLCWVDLAGKRLATLNAPDDFDTLEVSPDGRLAAVVRHDSLSGHFKVWLASLPAGAFEPVSDLAHVEGCFWSRDSSTLYYSEFRQKKLYRRRVNPLGPEEQVWGDFTFEARAVTPDGQKMLVFRHSEPTRFELGWTTLDRAQFHPLPGANHGSVSPSLSPDGRWLAVSDDRTGRSEIYVMNFPEGSITRRISTEGGTLPRWQPDGRELFFVGGDGMLMRAGWTGERAGNADAPKALFQSHLRGSTGWSYYAVANDGLRLLVIDAGEDPGKSTIDMILNWPSLLPQ